MRKEAKGIARALKMRIKDRNSDIAITRSGIEIRANIDAINAKVQTLEVGQSQQGQALLSQVTSQHDTPATAITDELREMASAYLRIEIPDWAERTRAKDAAANEMGLYVVSHNVPRDDLARENDEGLILALASAVLLDPQPEDADRLLAASAGVYRLHVRYRVLLAFSRLMERRMLTSAQIAGLRKTLDRFRIGADDSLLRHISWTVSLLDTAPAAPT